MSHTESNVTVEVTIPEDVEAGDTITIQCPDNSYVEFIAPAEVTSGDTVHVVVDGCKESEDASVGHPLPLEVSKTSYRGVAAVTTGVLVSALVIGPVVTGIFVVGMVVCAAQKSKAQVAPVSPTIEESIEEGATVPESSSTEQPMLPQPDPETREEKIAAAFVRTADYIADKWGAIDDRFALSSNTLRAIATVQEMDERNKVSETVVTKVKDFDEKYKVSEKAGNAVTATVTKVHEIDASCKISENALIAGNNIAVAGNNAVTCVGDFERRYEISTRVTTALLFAVSVLTDALSVYMRRLTHPATPAEVVPSAVINAGSQVDIDLEGGNNGEEKEEDLSLPEVPTHEVPRYASYAQAVQADVPNEIREQTAEPSTSSNMRSVEIPV